MIKANHTLIGQLFFNFYSNFRMKKHFSEIRFVGEVEDNGMPVLIIANHFSWWDGFIQLQLNNRYLKRKFHVMMLEEQLKKNMILNKGGAFSIQKNSRGMLESLNYSIDLLSDNNNVLLIFPQGEVQSLYTDNFIFEKGVDFLLKNKKIEFQCIFNINMVDYLSEKKPKLTVYFKKHKFYPASDIQQIERDFNTFARDCKLAQQKIT